MRPADLPPLPPLPNAPRVIDAPRQQALTERFLLPAWDALNSLFLGIRARLDPQLAQQQPSKWGKPYPLGQCLEITLAVKRDLRTLNPASLHGDAAQGYAALSAFLSHGGAMDQVWGDLRGEYFQNAFLAGTLYIDVSNDTVVRSKPPVEIMPLAGAQFSAVADFQHFARIAGRYWQATMHPNHLLPALAPYYPFIAAIPGGGIRLEADSAYMVLLAQRQAFRSSQAVLATAPLTDALFQPLRRALAATSLVVADNPAQGRTAALHHCQHNAAAGPLLADAQRAALGRAIAQVNRCWSPLAVSGCAAPESGGLSKQ